ncbi:MAG: DUF4097 family beta strand repeat protein [Melioribacteraceae bacterium]|nr:DUF4097 family beta strand repeat protein [Melioribacteraceae bacterium]
MKANIILLIVLIILFFIGATNAPVNVLELKDKKIDKSFKVSQGQKLILDLEIGADIIIEGWEKDELTLIAELSGDAEEILVEFDQTPNSVEVKAECENDDGCDCDAVFSIKIPKRFDVKFITMGGDIFVNKVDGEIAGTTMGGDLKMNNLKGTIELTTMGGDIELKNSDVDGNVKTMGGNVNVEDVTGDVDAESMGGDIKQNNVKRRSSSSVGDEVHISTMGGDIEVDEAPFGAKVKTMGGDIIVNKAEKYVDAHTMGGDIDIKSVDGWVKLKTMGGDIKVKYNGDPQADDRDFTITSMGGDIKIYLPENFSMELELEVMYDKHHEDDARISSDFSISEERSAEWKKIDGKKNKTITGNGIQAGGKNKLSVRTRNGGIYLIKNK